MPDDNNQLTDDQLQNLRDSVETSTGPVQEPEPESSEEPTAMDRYLNDNEDISVEGDTESDDQDTSPSPPPTTDTNPEPPETGPGGIPQGDQVSTPTADSDSHSSSNNDSTSDTTQTDSDNSSSSPPSTSDPEPAPPETGPGGIPQGDQVSTPTADADTDTGPDSTPPSDTESSSETSQSESSQSQPQSGSDTSTSDSRDPEDIPPEERTDMQQYLAENEDVSMDNDIDPGGPDNLDDPGSVVQLESGRIVSEDRYRTLQDAAEQINQPDAPESGPGGVPQGDQVSTPTAEPDTPEVGPEDLRVGTNEDGERVVEGSTQFREEQFAEAVENQPGVEEDVTAEDVLQDASGGDPELTPETADAVRIDKIEAAAVEQANESEQFESDITEDDVSVQGGDPDLTLDAKREEIAESEGVDVSRVTVESGGDFTIEPLESDSALDDGADTSATGRNDSAQTVPLGDETFLATSESDVRENVADELGVSPGRVRFEKRDGQTVATVGQPRGAEVDTSEPYSGGDLPDDVRLPVDARNSGQVTDAPTAEEVEASNRGFSDVVDESGDFLADAPQIIQQESLSASQAVQQDLVNPAAAEFGGAVGSVAGETAGGVTRKFTEGAGMLASGAVALPALGVTAGELGVGATKFTAKAVEEEGLIEGSQTSAEAGTNVTANFVASEAQSMINNPIRTSGGFAAGLGVGRLISRSGTLASGRTGKVLRYTDPDPRRLVRGGKKVKGAVESRFRSDVDADGLDVGQPADSLLDADAVDDARNVEAPSLTDRARGEFERITGRQQTSAPELVDDQAAMGPVQVSPDADTRTFDSPETRDPTRPEDVGGSFEDVRQDSLTQTQDALRDVGRRERASTERSVDVDTDPVSGRPRRSIDNDGTQRDRFGDRVTEPQRTTTPDAEPRATPTGQTGVAGAVTEGVRERQELAQRQEVTAGPTTPDRIREDTSLTQTPAQDVNGGTLLDEETQQQVTSPTLGPVTAPGVTEDVNFGIGQTLLIGERPLVDQPQDIRQTPDTTPLTTPRETPQTTPLLTPDEQITPDPDPGPDPDPDPDLTPDPSPDPEPNPDPDPDPDPDPTPEIDVDDDDEMLFGRGRFDDVRFENPIASGRDVLF